MFRGRKSLMKLFQTSTRDIEDMVNLIQKTYVIIEQPEVRIKGKDVTLPANRVIEASCKASDGQIKNKRVM